MINETPRFLLGIALIIIGIYLLIGRSPRDSIHANWLYRHAFLFTTFGILVLFKMLVQTLELPLQPNNVNMAMYYGIFFGVSSIILSLILINTKKPRDTFHSEWIYRQSGIFTSLGLIILLLVLFHLMGILPWW